MSKVGWIDHGDYWELSAPQGDDLWLEGRKGRITTSVSGAMVGISKFKTPEEQGKIIAGIVEEEFTEDEIERMSHGTNNEGPCREWYSNVIGKEIREMGLVVPKWDMQIGASVDGVIVGTEGIIEIKCPVRMYYPLEQYMDQKQTGWIPGPKYFKHIWPTHLSQMYHAMAVMGKKYCVYIVYSTVDKTVFTQTIPFDPDYWNDHYAILKENYDTYVNPYLDGKYPLMP